MPPGDEWVDTPLATILCPCVRFRADYSGKGIDWQKLLVLSSQRYLHYATSCSRPRAERVQRLLPGGGLPSCLVFDRIRRWRVLCQEGGMAMETCEMGEGNTTC